MSIIFHKFTSLFNCKYITKSFAVMAIFSLVLFSNVTAANASHTFLGYGGLVYIPTDEITPFHTARFGFSVIGGDSSLEQIGLDSGSNIGIFSFGFFPNMDAGVAIFRDSVGEIQYAVNAKAVLLPQLGDTQVSVTAGVWDAFGDHNFSPYIVVGKRLDVPINDVMISDLELSLNLGYGGGIYGNAAFAGAGLKTTGGFEFAIEAVNDFVNCGLCMRRGPFSIGVSFIDFTDAVVSGGIDWEL